MRYLSPLERAKIATQKEVDQERLEAWCTKRDYAARDAYLAVIDRRKSFRVIEGGKPSLPICKL